MQSPEYIMPDASEKQIGKSPLVMLQEICKSIGSDLPINETKPKRPSSSSNTARRGSTSPTTQVHKTPSPKHTRHQPYNKRSTVLASASSSSKEYLPSQAQQLPVKASATGCCKPPLTQTEAEKQMAAQYQLMYQRLYMTELDRLKSSPPYLPTPLPVPEQKSTPAPSLNEVSRLAAYFYSKLQNSPPLLNESLQTPITLQPPSALHTDMNKLLAERLGLLTPPTPLLKPNVTTSDQRLTNCHWVTADGFCGRSFGSNEELLLHLRSHVCNMSDISSLYTQPSLPAPQQYASAGLEHFSKMFTCMNKPSSLFRSHPYNLPLLQRPTSLYH